MTLILILGDAHCSRTAMQYAYKTAFEKGCQLIIQVGDFGFDPTDAFGIRYLETINKLGKKFKIDTWWLDGNHENHDEIDRLLGGHYNSISPFTRRESKQQHGSFIEYPYIRYLPRGYRFDIDDVSFMTYGGAFSVDRHRRTLGVSWFHQETIDLDHVRSLPDEHVDVLLTHDVPEGYKGFPYDKMSNLSLISQNARDALYILAQKTTPKLCIGGHHHLRDTFNIYHEAGVAQCHILDCDGTGTASWYILDTESVKKMEYIVLTAKA